MSDRHNKLDSGFDIGKTLVDNLASNVDGIISTKNAVKYASGARTTLKINNKIIGFAFSIAWNIQTIVTEVETIDDYLPFELAPKRIRVSGTMGMFHIPGLGATSELIQADFLNFLHQKYIAIEVRDSATDDLLFFTSKAMVTSRAETLAAESLGRVQLNWQAVGWKDEREPRVPVELGTKSLIDLGNAVRIPTFP